VQVEWILLIVGGVTLVAGSALTLVGLATLQANHRPSRQSFLAPVLAIDALDTDLRVAYSKTMVLDARACAEDRSIEENGLGAEIRRLILAIQVARGRGEDIQVDLLGLVEPIGDWSAQKKTVRALRFQIKKEERPG
jgi:hypothetical protein